MYHKPVNRTMHLSCLRERKRGRFIRRYDTPFFHFVHSFSIDLLFVFFFFKSRTFNTIDRQKAAIKKVTAKISISALLTSSQLLDKEFQIGSRRIVKTQFHPHLPVPISTGAIPEAIPYPQKKPGKRRQNNKNQIGQSCLIPSPPKNDKQDDAGMKNKEKNVQKGVHVLCLYQY